jgi:hypothetical protein
MADPAEGPGIGPAGWRWVELGRSRACDAAIDRRWLTRESDRERYEWVGESLLFGAKAVD